MWEARGVGTYSKTYLGILGLKSISLPLIILISETPIMLNSMQGICPPFQSRGWGICKFCAARGPGICQARGHPELSTRTRFPIKIELHRGFYWKNKQIGSFFKDWKKLKSFVKACPRFYACISSLLIKPEFHSEIGSYRRETTFLLVIESNFC